MPSSLLPPCSFDSCLPSAFGHIHHLWIRRLWWLDVNSTTSSEKANMADDTQCIWQSDCNLYTSVMGCRCLWVWAEVVVCFVEGGGGTCAGAVELHQARSQTHHRAGCLQTVWRGQGSCPISCPFHKGCSPGKTVDRGPGILVNAVFCCCDETLRRT